MASQRKDSRPKQHTHDTTQELLRSLFEESSDGILIINEKGHYVDANPRGCEMLGYSREQLLKLSLKDLLPPADLDNDPLLQADLGKEKTEIKERRLRCKDGGLLQVKICSRMLPDGMLLGLVRDVSERKLAQNEIRKSEERYRLLFDSNPHPMWVYDLETLTFLAVNGAAVAKYGFTRDEFMRMTIADIRPTEDIPKLMGNISHVTHGLDEAGSWRHRKKDGSILVVEITSHTIFWDGRQAELVLAQDITERKRAEEALREREIKFRNVFDHSVDAIGVSKLGIHVLVNSAYLALFQYTHSHELTGKPISDLIAPSERRKISDYVQLRAKGMSPPASYETRGLRKNGSEFDMDVKVSNYELNGETYTLVILRDITGRKRAEEALRQSEERLRTIIETEPECVKIVSRDGQLLEMNAAGLAMLEAPTLPEAQQHTLLNFILPEHRAAFRALHERVMRGESGTLEFEVAGLRGTRRWLETHAAPMRNATGEVARLLGVTRDITERKRAEEELRERKSFIEAILANAPIGFAVNRISDGKSLLVNNKFTEIYGIPHSDTMTVDEFFEKVYTDPGYRQQIRERIIADIASGDASRMRWENIPITTAKREHKVVTAVNIPLWDQDLMVSTVQDVTERKRAEEALRESDTKYRQLIETMQDGVYRSSHDGKFLEVNPAMVKTLGYDSKEELLSIDIKSQLYFAPEDRESAALDEKFQEMAVFRLRKKDGSEIWVEDHGRHVVDGEGTVLYHEGVLRDVTERKKAEVALRESEERYRTLAHTLPDAVVVMDKTGISPTHHQLP